jgi:hypothetical protein
MLLPADLRDWVPERQLLLLQVSIFGLRYLELFKNSGRMVWLASSECAISVISRQWRARPEAAS